MTADEKVMADLSTLSDQIDACRRMLAAPDMKTSADVDGNETLLVYVGFLEACVSRMKQLVEGALSTGALGENTIEKVFLMNDRLNKTLEDCDDPSKVTEEAAAPAAAAAAAAAATVPPADDMFDPFGETSDTSAEVDPFASPAAAAATPTSSTATAAAATTSTSAADDPFDLLAKERAPR